MSGALKIPGVSDVLRGMKQTTPKSTPEITNVANCRVEVFDHAEAFGKAEVGEARVYLRMWQLDHWCQAVDKIRPDAEETVRAFLERNKDCGLRPHEVLAGLSVALNNELKKLY